MQSHNINRDDADGWTHSIGGILNLNLNKTAGIGNQVFSEEVFISVNSSLRRIHKPKHPVLYAIVVAAFFSTGINHRIDCDGSTFGIVSPFKVDSGKLQKSTFHTGDNY